MWSQPSSAQPNSTNGGPSPRAAHSCDLIGNKLFVFGGWNGKSALNDLHVLDFETSKWKQVELRGVPPSSRNNHTIAMVGIKLYLHGGHDGKQWLNDLHVLDTDRREWSTPSVSGNLPSSRACHTLTRVGQKLYLFGGYDGKKCFNDIDVFDLDTNYWSRPRCFGTTPTPRNAHSVTSVGRKLYLFGGHSGNKHLSDLHAFDVETFTWEQIETCGRPPPGLRGHTASAIGTKIYFFGGYDGRGRSNLVFTLNLLGGGAIHGIEEGDDDIKMRQNNNNNNNSLKSSSHSKLMEWNHPKITEKAPVGRQRHTACLVGSKKLYILGGFDGYKWLNDLHILDVGQLEKSTLKKQATDTLLGNMRLLLNNPDMFPDVVFIIENKRIYAHKAIIAVQCDVFKAMLSNGMKESKQQEIQIHEWSYDSFLSMLEFLYTGQIEQFDANSAVNLLSLVDHYTLDGLRELCENTLIRSIKLDNACLLLRMSEQSGAQMLKKYCLQYVLSNFEKIVETKAFDDLKSDPQLLLEITKASMGRKK